MPTKIQDMTSWGPLGDPTTRPSSLLDSTSSPASLSHSSQPPGSVQTWTPQPHDIGKRVGEKRWELSVVCDAAEAMRVQFDVASRTHIALHDVGSQTSRRFLAGVAAAMHAPVQHLAIRRQGYGDTLATLHFVDLPTCDGDGRASSSLRIYSTAATEPDAKAGRQLANILLGRSRLAVVMIAADAQAQALAISLGSVKDAISQAMWSNRSMLMLPLREIKALASITAHLNHIKKMDIRIAPAVARPVDAWNHLRSTWNVVTREAAEAGDARAMLLSDPTRANDAASSALSAARLAERVASGRATADELRRHLEMAAHGKSKTATSALSQVVDPAPPQPQQKAAQSVSVGRPTMPDTVARAPAWTPVTAPPAGPEAPPNAFAQVMGASSNDAWPTLHAEVAAGAPPAQGMTAAALATGSPASAKALAATTVAPASSHPAPSATKPTPELIAFHDHCAQIKGMQRCGIVDVQARQTVVSHGVDNVVSWASEGTRLINAMRAAAMTLALPGRLPEASMTYETHHLVVCALPSHPTLAFVGILDKAQTNPAMVQIKLQRLAAGMVKSQDTEIAAYGQR